MISLLLTLPWQPLFYSSLVLLSLFFDIRGKIGVILVMFVTLYWSFPPFALLFFVEVHRRRSYVLPYFPARIKSFIIMERWWLIYVILFFLLWVTEINAGCIPLLLSLGDCVIEQPPAHSRNTWSFSLPSSIRFVSVASICGWSPSNATQMQAYFCLAFLALYDSYSRFRCSSSSLRKEISDNWASASVTTLEIMHRLKGRANVPTSV